MTFRLGDLVQVRYSQLVKNGIQGCYLVVVEDTDDNSIIGYMCNLDSTTNDEEWFEQVDKRLVDKVGRAIVIEDYRNLEKRITGWKEGIKKFKELQRKEFKEETSNI